MPITAPTVSTELLAALSLSTDLANGLPAETALRSAVLAATLAECAGLSDSVREEAFVTGVLRFIGCTAFAHEEAELAGGDDVAFRRAYKDIDPGRSIDLARVAMAEVGRGRPLVERAGLVLRAAVDGAQAARALAGCDVARQLGEGLGASEGLLRNLAQLFERWDGRGHPLGLAEAGIAVTVRLVHVAAVAEHALRIGGVPGVLRELARRRGTQLDPAFVDLLARDSGAILQAVSGPSVWDLAVSRQGTFDACLRPDSAASIAEAFGHFVDLQSVFTLGHSAAVARLVTLGARAAKLSPAAQVTLRLAGHLHDLGRVSVPTGTWEKPGALSWSEWERVRLHPYHTERLLSQCRDFADVARIAGAHHERLDGSGYFRGISGDALDLPARLLGAADSYQAMLEPRPHRPAFTPEKAARELWRAAKAGALDPAAVSAILDAAGHVVPASRATWPAGLTDREVDVLRELARGNTRATIARALGIGERTVRHHIQQIYGKTAIRSRAGIALFAVEHGLL